ncbi:hypothetical protein H0H81_011325 [Sphagnurus paluster]|uniref:F-box domain-containing protein n=1 Tax=Sphagnurus paluster TaxID=117069 RepID=A0A9P7FQG5_9AGAR|nr:hypothetical protein H0H81_011325 [Sphagnurus paluster]
MCYKISDLEDIMNTLSRNNQRPSPHQSQTISAFISNRGADLARTQVDICLVQLKVNQLLTEMKDLQSKTIQIKEEIQKCKPYLTTVRLLPPEILIKIFLHSIISGLEWGFPRRRSYPPLSVSQVCSSWRQASLMCPQLWSMTAISFHKYRYIIPGRAGRAIELINQWYSRAKGCPLAFSLYYDAFANSDGKDLTDVTYALLPFSQRIYSLRFKVDKWDRVATFLLQCSAPMLALEKLEISTIYQTSEHLSVRLFRDAPALRDVTLGISSSVVAMPPDFEFPWAQLTRLVLEEITDSAFYHIFTQCRSLVRASFRVNLDRGSQLSFPGELPDRFVFQNLEALRLQFCEYERGSSITMNAVSFPVMKNFELSAMESSFLNSIHTIATLLNTHSPTSAALLTCLVLTNVEVDHYHFATMLGACLALEKLAVESHPDLEDDTLIALLGDTRASSPPAPSLPNLTAFALVANDQIFDTLPQQLSRLVYKWSSNPARRRPFNAVFVYYDDVNGYYEPKGVFQELRELLGPWRINNPVQSIAESGMILRTRMISKILNDLGPPVEIFNLSSELKWLEV